MTGMLLSNSFVCLTPSREGLWPMEWAQCDTLPCHLRCLFFSFHFVGAFDVLKCSFHSAYSVSSPSRALPQPCPVLPRVSGSASLPLFRSLSSLSRVSFTPGVSQWPFPLHCEFPQHFPICFSSLHRQTNVMQCPSIFMSRRPRKSFRANGKSKSCIMQTLLLVNPATHFAIVSLCQPSCCLSLLFAP